MPEPLRPASTRQPTLHDVAQAAGVSLITASRALNNPARVAAATRERVQAAAQAVGYVPNLLAGGLKSRRSRTIAALVPGLSVQQFLPTVQALTQELDKAGYQLLLGQTGYDRARESALLQAMASRRVDGIVAAGLLEPGAAAEQVRGLGIPIVETWELSERPLDMAVGFSHLKVGSAVAGFFLSRGWQRVGLAIGNDRRAAIRREGFLSAIGRDVPTAVVPAPSSVASGRLACARLLEQDPGLRAIFCSADALAEGVLTEARAQGIRVPQDLAVCGFGDADFAAHLLPALTTVHVDGAEIGRLAAQMLLRRCEGLAVEPRVVDVGFRIVERESTAGAAPAR